jgi:hypothetical protein
MKTHYKSDVLLFIGDIVPLAEMNKFIKSHFLRVAFLNHNPYFPNKTPDA